MSDKDPTLEFYAEHAQNYAARDEDGAFIGFREAFARQLSLGAKVLELGSGSGRDALALLQQGFDVTLLDGSAELAEIARERTGCAVIVRDFQDINFREEFDGIFAAASLLHVPSSKLPNVMALVANSLRKGGILAASFKESDQDWTDGFGRYFCAMNAEDLRSLVEAAGLSVSSIDSHEGKGSDGRDTTWLWVSAQKDS